MAGKGIVIQISGDGESAKRALDMVQQHLHSTGESAKHEASEIAESMERVKNALETVGLYMGIREGIQVLKEMTVGSFELGETLAKASEKTGLAVETLSTLKYAAAVTGSDFEGLTSAVSKMDKAIGAATSGNKTAQAVMKALGLNAQELAGRSDGAEIAFKKFTETLAATENPIRRVQLATSLLGKAGADQIPMLLDVGNHWDQYVERAKSAGVYMTGEGARSLEEMNQKLKDMEQHVTGAGIAFSEGLTPALTGILEAISGGKSTLDTLTEWGRDVGRTLAFVAEVAYSTVAALEAVFATAELGKLTEAGRKDQAAVQDLLKQAQKFHDIAFGDAPAKTPKADESKRTGGSGGFEGIGDQSKQVKAKGDDSIARAQTALIQEQAKASLDAQKDTTKAMLAELEAQHKVFLVSDQDFYQEKLRLQISEFEAEIAALKSQESALGSLYAKQSADKTLKRDKQGNSAEQLRTQREMLQIEEQIAAVVARSQEAGSASNAEISAHNQATELAGLREAAELEKERNAGIEAQIALIRREKELEAQKVSQAGGTESDVANVRALGEVAAQKLRIGEIDKQIISTENDYKRAVEDVNDAEQKYPLLKQKAAAEVNRLNAAEAAQLRALVQQYEQLAQVLGGEYVEKAKVLEEELNKLSRPNQKQDSEFTKSLVEGLEGVSRKIVDTAEKGKASWHDMAKSMELDMLNLAVKLAEQKWLTPLLTGALGGGKTGALPQSSLGSALPQAASSGGGGGGGILSKITGGLLGGGGDAKGGGVVIKIENNSSTPMAASQASQSYDEDMKQTVIHWVLSDATEGGALSHLFGGG